MNLDELMAVWKLQDTAPLHDVNKTLLHQALRQDEAKLQKWRRICRWMIYLWSAVTLAAMALFLAMMIYAHERKVMTGWDFAIGIGGAAAALLAGGAMYVHHKGQARREQRFDESLRDQLNRHIAQLDERAMRARIALVIVLLAGICPIAINLILQRINGKSVSDDGYMIVWLISFSAVCPAAIAVWLLRYQAPDALPRKRRLEELLKELDGQ